MKALLIYWIIGCIVIGVGAGVTQRQCPNDIFDVSKMVQVIAVWPGFLIGGIVANLPKSECKHP